MKQGFWIVLSIIVIAMAMLYLQQYRPHSEGDEIQLEAADCDVAEQGCQIGHQGILYQLVMTRPQGLKPFQLTFKSSVSDLANVSVQFDMLGMDMQQPTQPLEQVDTGHWQREAILPICSSGRSDWVAWIRFQYQGNNYRLQFPFTVY